MLGLLALAATCADRLKPRYRTKPQLKVCQPVDGGTRLSAVAMDVDTESASVPASAVIVESPRPADIDFQSGAGVAELSSSPPSSSFVSPSCLPRSCHAYPQAFRPYTSLLQRYPLLPTPSNLDSSISRFTLPRPTTSLTRLDHRLLSSIILTRVIGRKPGMVMCAAEAAGGTCADRSCSNLHLVQDLGRPDGESPLSMLSGVLTIRFYRRRPRRVPGPSHEWPARSQSSRNHPGPCQKGVESGQAACCW